MAHTTRDNRHPKEGAEDSAGISESFKREMQINGPRGSRKTKQGKQKTESH